MKSVKPVLYFLIAMILAACDDSPTDVTDSDLMVVQAFLYADEPVEDVRITTAIPLTSTATSVTPINDAQVRLIRDDVGYDLLPTGTEGYYHYSGDDLNVAVGDNFRIEVIHQGKMASAETTVPTPPQGVEISDDVLYVPEFARGPGGRPSLSSLEVTWTNPDQLLHFVVIESLDDNAESILPEFAQQRFGGFRFVSLPTGGDTYTINFRVLEVLGPHRARVYRINQEYADLYENRIQDSRDLNEPPANIEGALGVFSAFSSDSVFFQVVRE